MPSKPLRTLIVDAASADGARLARSGCRHTGSWPSQHGSEPPCHNLLRLSCISSIDRSKRMVAPLKSCRAGPTAIVLPLARVSGGRWLFQEVATREERTRWGERRRCRLPCHPRASDWGLSKNLEQFCYCFLFYFSMETIEDRWIKASAFHSVGYKYNRLLRYIPIITYSTPAPNHDEALQGEMSTEGAQRSPCAAWSYHARCRWSGYWGRRCPAHA
jgi:hypothetical protein